MKCTYRLKSVKDTLNPEQIKSGLIDIQTLQIGEKMSKYFSRSYLDYNLKSQELSKKSQNIPTFTNNGSYGYEIFCKTDLVNKITVTDLGTMLFANFKYEDDISDMNWIIKKDTMTILSYLCQKAVTTFRGRIYEAWFTNEVPINNGPWKFRGLPGLIMKVSDLQKYFVFECVGIQKLKKKEPIKFYTVKYTDISRKDLQKLYVRTHNDLAASSQMKGVTLAQRNPTTGKLEKVTHSKKKLEYNPIELK